MKKITAIIAAILVMAVLCFTACGREQNPDPPEDVNSLAPHRERSDYAVKKGLCVSKYNKGGKAAADKVNDLGCSWYYNWGLKPENEYIDAEFVPMMWGKWSVTDENIAYVKENYESGKFKYLLTFNEPDLPDQANMSVDEALSYWEKLESIGIPLSSPAVSWYIGDGNAWLDDFMKKAEEREYRVDFITVHSYLPFYYVDDMVRSLAEDTLDKLYERYHKPIWVTEFGAIDTIAREQHWGHLSSDCTEEKAVEFIQKSAAMLEGKDYVMRYSWFLDNLGDDRPYEAVYTALYDENDEIAATGEAYKEISAVPPLAFETESLPLAAVGENYSARVYVCGGTGDYSFSADNLPVGLTISKSGRISGIPQLVGAYQVEITATDEGEGDRAQTVKQIFSLGVKNNG